MKSYISIRKKEIKRRNRRKITLLLMTMMMMLIVLSVSADEAKPDTNQINILFNSVRTLNNIDLNDVISETTLDDEEVILYNDNITIVDEPEPVENDINKDICFMDISADYVFMNGSNSNFSDRSIVDSYSGLSVDDISYILEDIPNLYPYAQKFYDIEQIYGVNALFVMAVTSLESYYGESRIANECNNLFGFMRKGSPIEFSSKEKSIEYFGDLISKYYIDQGLMCPDDISHKYEPKDPTGWSYKVTALMNQYADKLLEIK